VKISLITVVYNRAATIERTILSVLEQSYPHIEYIVVDGASTDGTLSIIQQYSHRIDTIISEKDNGVYDAINKGIQNATGDIVGVLHADDCFTHNDVIKNVVAQFNQHPFAECLFGDVCFVRPQNPNEIIRYISSSIFNTNRFSYGIMPAHPTFYCYKKYFDLHGLYRTDLDIASDFDLLLRFLKIHNLKYIYIPELMINMNLGGKSTSGLKSTLTINKEIRRVLKDYKIKSSYLHLYSRYFIKIREFFYNKR
jgi:glycosyltransferase involved in cell wall biosynthesis